MNEQFSQTTHHTSNHRFRGWVGGAILVALGLFMLLQNFIDIHLNNWWALFILIPAAGAFANAWDEYRTSNLHLTMRARKSLSAGLFLTVVTAMLLFGIPLHILLPLALVMVGASILINNIVPE